MIYKQLMLAGCGLGAIGLHSAICRMADDGEPIGIIELEDNLADVEKPPEIPAGRYKAELQDIQLPTSQKGNQYFAMKFVIPVDELPADVRDSYPDGAILYYNRIIVPTAGNRRALYNVRQFVEAIGGDVNTNQIDPNDWMGKEATLVIRMGKYQGEDRAEIGAVLSAESTAAPRQQAEKTAAPTSKRGGAKRGR